MLTRQEDLVSTGVVFRLQSPPEQLREAVEAADAAGSAVEELWLWEDCFLEGGLTTAAAALAWSTRLRVGIGLLPVPLRNPALVAMEVATLARLFPDRVVVGLGHGVLDWMEQVGARVESPMTLLREHTSAVTALLAGERVAVSGRYVHLDDVALDCATAQEGRDVGGRGGEVHVAVYTQVADHEVTAGAVAERVSTYAAAGADAVVLQAGPDSPDPRPLIEALTG